MGLHLKITGLLLLVQVFHLALFQNATDSPQPTIINNNPWLRDRLKNTAEIQNATNTKEELGFHTGSEADGDATNEYSSGIASGSMAIYDEGEENAASEAKRVNETLPGLTADATTMPPAVLTNGTTRKAKSPDATVSPTHVTSDHTNSGQIHDTEAKKEFHNSTTHLSIRNFTSYSINNHTGLLTTTSAPERSTTPESTKKPNNHTGLSNATESTSKTTATTSTKPEKKETSTSSPSTTVIPTETTGTSATPTTIAAPITPEKDNKTEKDAASGSSSERGLATDNRSSKRNGAWGAVLGTAVAVASLGLVAYIILKKKHRKGFSHSKLVEDYPSNPVHRLDNAAPLDLNFAVGGSAYYNPGLQGDNIQMTNFPGRHGN